MTYVGKNTGIYGTLWKAMGERKNAGTTATGEDLWLGTATSIPVPADAGEAMYVVSTSANDAAAGTGVQEITLQCLNPSGSEVTYTVVPDGTTPVLVEGGVLIRYVNDMYSSGGFGNVAAGDITIYKSGASSTIYNMIAVGGNKSLVPNRMVPLGKELRLISWHGECSANDEVSIRIRSTDMNGVLIPGVFCFKDAAFLYRTTTGQLELGDIIPALSKIKVSAWPMTSGGEFSCGWRGDLTDA